MQVESLSENKYRNPLLKDDEEMLENGIKRRKWFDKGLFNDDISDDEDDIAGSDDEGELDVSSEEEEEEEKKTKKVGSTKPKKAAVGFVNPLKKSHLVEKSDEVNEEEVQFGSEDDYEDEDDHLHGKNS